MRIIDPGHLYGLGNLESEGEQILRFMKDPLLHGGGGYAGTTCQEALRAVIDRVQTLNAERPYHGNEGIIYDLRHAIAGFEARAVIRRVEKTGLAIERQPIDIDGHLLWAPPK